MSLSLNSLLKVGVSTYENPIMDTVYNQMKYDLDECKSIKDGKEVISVQGLGDVAIDDIECDDGLDFDKFKIDVAKYFEDELKEIDLKGIFAKYGLDYTGITFYTPKEYNFESDSVDIHLKTMRSEYDLKSLGLIPYIDEYIENVRQESYDGYMSFEPTKLDYVGIEDYCTIWAILKKENVFDQLKEIMQGCVDEGYSELVRKNASPTYRVNKKTVMSIDGDNDTRLSERNDYKLDFDNKILLPIE